MAPFRPRIPEDLEARIERMLPEDVSKERFTRRLIIEALEKRERKAGVVPEEESGLPPVNGSGGLPTSAVPGFTPPRPVVATVHPSSDVKRNVKPVVKGASSGGRRR